MIEFTDVVIDHYEYEKSLDKKWITDTLRVETCIKDYKEIGEFHEFHDGEVCYFGFDWEAE